MWKNLRLLGRGDNENVLVCTKKGRLRARVYQYSKGAANLSQFAGTPGSIGKKAFFKRGNF